jgi:hypothetical protein
MKTFLLITLCVVFGAAGGYLAGRSSAPSVRIEGIEVHTKEGTPPPEVLSTVNDEMPKRIERVVGPYRTMQHLIVVTPSAAGYIEWKVGPSDSKIWSHEAWHSLQAGERINEICDSLSKMKRKLEQGAAPNGP